MCSLQWVNKTTEKNVSRNEHSQDVVNMVYLLMLNVKSIFFRNGHKKEENGTKATRTQKINKK
jgi:hypothetical protein